MMYDMVVMVCYDDDDDVYGDGYRSGYGNGDDLGAYDHV